MLATIVSIYGNSNGNTNLTTNLEKLKILLHTGLHPCNSFNRKDEVTLNRLGIGHSKMSHGHLMRREEPTQCQTCVEHLTVKHLLVHCQNHVET